MTTINYTFYPNDGDDERYAEELVERLYEEYIAGDERPTYDSLSAAVVTLLKEDKAIEAELVLGYLLTEQLAGQVADPYDVVELVDEVTVSVVDDKLQTVALTIHMDAV
jgi:hypothetical protein